MKKQNFIKTLKPYVKDNEMVFSCFHDGMFVYEYCISEEDVISIETSFFAKEDAMFLNSESLDNLIDNIDFTKYVGISTVGNINNIDISDAYTN